MGNSQGATQDTWPAGATWVFQGTVAEDATGGTHVCSLTVTPGAGNEFKILYGRVTEGNTATAQTTLIFIDDGTNAITYLQQDAADITASITKAFPVAGVASVGAGSSTFTAGGVDLIVSGTMRLVLQVTTAAVSVTQTFSVACRIKGAVPTATLADTIGTPVLTTNTNQVF